MTSELTYTNEQSPTESRSGTWRLVPAVGLFLLAPLVGEFLLGNPSITSLPFLLLLAPLYGGGALLIRERGRRWGLLLVGAFLFWRWSHRTAWSPRHSLGIAGGLLMTYAWYGFIQPPSVAGATPQIDLIGNAVFALGALILLIVAVRRVANEAPHEPLAGA